MSPTSLPVRLVFAAFILVGVGAAFVGGAAAQSPRDAGSYEGGMSKHSGEVERAQPGESAAGEVADDEQAEGLDSELVYSVLVAELAARRGNLRLAFNYYLYSAQLSRSSVMVELAVRAALASDDPEAIRRGVELWHELVPDSAGAHQVAALLAIQDEDRVSALSHLKAVVRLSEEDPAAGYTRAVGIIAQSKDADARVELMQALVDADPESAEAQQALAMVAAGAERYEVAEAAAREALRLRPGWTRPRIFLVRLMISLDKRDQARALLEEYVAAKPEDRALRMLYGQLLVEENELSSARHELEHILGSHPKAPDVLFAVGVLSLELDDLDAARVYFKRLYDTGARRDESLFYLGQVEELAENLDKALEWYGKVSAGGENALDAGLRSALIWAKRGSVGRAREMLQRLRGEYPENARYLYLAEAEILAEVEREDEALEAYGNALAAFPGHPDLLYARAMYAVSIDRIALAERDLRRLIDDDPENVDALNALGYTLADRTQRYEEARQLIEAAYRLRPDAPAIIDSMGWVQYRLGNNEVALGYLEKALALLDDGEIAAHVGEVLWALGRREEAWEVWESALEAHPEHAYLQAVVARYRLSSNDHGDDPAQ